MMDNPGDRDLSFHSMVLDLTDPVQKLFALCAFSVPPRLGMSLPEVLHKSIFPSKYQHAYQQEYQ